LHLALVHSVMHFQLCLIADYKLPELFRIGSEPLLRNQNGKFDKPALRALAVTSSAAGT
jgi:hypothetical protein